MSDSNKTTSPGATLSGAPLLSALQTLAQEYDTDPADFALSLVESLREEVMRFADTSDARVSFDLDTGDLTLTAIPDDEDPFDVQLADLGRRGAVAIKEAFGRAMNAARIAKMEELLADDTGSVVYGVVQQASDDAASVDLPNGAVGYLRAYDAPGLDLKRAALRRSTIAILVTGDVESSGGIPRAVLTRRTPEFVRQLLVQAVPSIEDGSITIDSLVREPGTRTKILVGSSDKFRDPAALVIGSRGATINKVTSEINPERIDVITEGALDDMVKSALLPARVFAVTLSDAEAHTDPRNITEADDDAALIAWVAQDQRALAFGRDGINVRLASALLGRHIQIKTLP